MRQIENLLFRLEPLGKQHDRDGFKCGEDLIFGSDGMPHGVEYALQWSLFPAFPGQRLTVAELVAGFGLPPTGQGRSTLTIDPDQRKVKLVASVPESSALPARAESR